MAELRRRAVAAGIDRAAIDAAEDEDDAKVALLNLIVHAEKALAYAAETKKRGAETKAEARGAREASLRLRLSRIEKISELRRTAEAVGVTEGAVEDALDDEDPRAALLDLIVATQMESPQNNGGHAPSVQAEAHEDAHDSTSAAAEHDDDNDVAAQAE
eukprot:SAG31_NODE_7902_length_1569_cov_1.417007_1_plen_158_part_10